MVPNEAPLPTPSNLPFQFARGGNHNSNRMSDSGVGLTVPTTRQNGTDTVTLFHRSRAPPATYAVNGGCTNPAEFTDQGSLPSPARTAHVFASEPVVSSLDCA